MGRTINSLIGFPRGLSFSIVTGFMGWSGLATLTSFLGILPEVAWTTSSLSALYIGWITFTTSKWKICLRKIRSILRKAGKVSDIDNIVYHRLSALAAASVTAVVYGAYGGMLARVPELGDSYWMHSQILNDIPTWGGIFNRLSVQPVFNFFPLGGNAAVAMPFIIAGLVGAKICLLCSTMGAVQSCSIIFSKSLLCSRKRLTISWLALLAILSNASIYLSITQLYQEAALTVAMAMLIALTAKLYRNTSGYRHIELLIMGFLAGLAAGMKLFMLPYVCIWFIAVFFDLKPVRYDGRELILLPTRISTVAIGMLIGAGSFYIRSFLLTGNPVFPFYNSFFKSPYFEAINFRDARWSRPLGWDWLFRASLGDYGEYIEASWGFIPILASAFVFIGILYLVYHSINSIYDKRSDRASSPWEWLVYLVLLVVPAFFILKQMSYARYITQSLVPLYIISIVAIVEYSSRFGSFFNRAILSACGSAIFMQIPFMDSGMYTYSRSPSNWKIGSLGIPTSRNEDHVLDADREVSNAINNDFRPTPDHLRATVFYLIGDGDALIDGTKIPIGPFPGTGLDKNKLMPIHSVWYFDLIHCLNDYDDKEAIAGQVAKVVDSFYPAYIVVENSDIAKSGFKRLSSMLNMSFLFKNHSVTVFRIGSRLSVSSAAALSLKPACERALKSSRAGYQF